MGYLLNRPEMSRSGVVG